MQKAESIAIDINAGEKTPGDLYRQLKVVHTAAVAEVRPRTVEALEEALTLLSGRRTVGTFHRYALETAWFDNVTNNALRELD